MAAMIDPPKARKNFTESDRQLLLSLVTPSIEVLKDLKKDTATNKKKEAVWAQIVVSFNANPTISARRTIDQLRKAWENICRRTKEEVAKNKQSRRQTGGGPAGPEVSTMSSSVAGALADTFNPLDNPFDGDAGHHGDDVIKLGSSSPDLVELDDETPKPNKCAATKFFISRRKRPITATKSSSSSSEATDELLKMRREEHEAKMDLLAWKTAYWRRKYEAEFGSTQEANGVSNSSLAISADESRYSYFNL
jgi:hypothetical protein